MATGRSLRTTLRTSLVTKYRKTDTDVNPQDVKDDLRYSDINYVFTNGAGGANKNDIQFHDRDQVISTTKIYNFDGTDVPNQVVNQWGDVLIFQAVKLIFLRNRETDITRFMLVTYKSEQFWIGAQGARQLEEPINVFIIASLSNNDALKNSHSFFNIVTRPVPV